MRRLPILCLGFTTLLGACAFDPAQPRTALLDDCAFHGVLPVLEDNRTFDDVCGSAEEPAGTWRFAMRDGDGAGNGGPGSDGPGPGGDGPGGDGPGSQGPGGDGGEPDAGGGDGGDGGGPPV